MADHKLDIVINRTMETGKWVADITVDEKNKKTTITLYQRADKFSPGTWIADRMQGLSSATKLSEKYLQALNFYPDHAFGTQSGVAHVRKPVKQSTLDRKIAQAAKTLHSNGSVNGPAGAPFAIKTKDFSAIHVTINDEFGAQQRTDEAISSIFSALEGLGEELSGGNQAYYRGLLKIALAVTGGDATLADNRSDAESAFNVLKMFKEKLAKSTNHLAYGQVAQLLGALGNHLGKSKADEGQSSAIPMNLSAPEVYGRRPIKPAALAATKNKTPGR